MAREKGFSMIEVLVTLVLISIGVLGIVAMQGRTIQYTQDSVQRNAAAMLANDLLEMMRADPDNLLEARAQLKKDSPYYKVKGEDFPLAPALCTPLPTNPNERLGCWAQYTAKSLPGSDELLNSQFHVCRSPAPGTCDSNKGSVIEIQIAWRVPDGACFNSDDPTLCTYTIRSEL